MEEPRLRRAPGRVRRGRHPRRGRRSTAHVHIVRPVPGDQPQRRRNGVRAGRRSVGRRAAPVDAGSRRCRVRASARAGPPDGQFLAVGGPLDDSLFRDVDRLRIVAGRTPRVDAPDEVVIGEALAQKARLGLGDVVPVKSYTPSQVAASPNGGGTPAAGRTEVRLRVVGISRSPDRPRPARLGGRRPPACRERSSRSTAHEIGNFSARTVACCSCGSETARRESTGSSDRLRHVLGRRPFDVDPTALTIGGVQESIDVLAIGVLVFGVIAGFAALIALGLIISRQVALVADGQTALRDLGMARRSRAAAIAGPVLFAIGFGALVAVIGAWVASPMLPFGIARTGRAPSRLELRCVGAHRRRTRDRDAARRRRDRGGVVARWSSPGRMSGPADGRPSSRGRSKPATSRRRAPSASAWRCTRDEAATRYPSGPRSWASRSPFSASRRSWSSRAASTISSTPRSRYGTSWDAHATEDRPRDVEPTVWARHEPAHSASTASKHSLGLAR